MAEAGDNTPRTVEIIGRPGSLYARVAFIFAEHLGVPWRLHLVDDLTVQDAAVYGGNPAMKIPVLRDGDQIVFGAENICRTLAARAAAHRQVTRLVWTEDLPDVLSRNAQELTWHCMAAQVQLVMGTVMSGLPADDVFFTKTRLGMESSLAWLDHHVDAVTTGLPQQRELSLLEVTLFCLVEHLSFRRTVPVEPYARLAAFAGRFGTLEAARVTPFRLQRVERA